MEALQRHEAAWTHPATHHALFYRTWRLADTQAVIVIVHGFGEHGGRYDELAQALAVHGVAACCLDLYGHGRSAGPRGDVATFADYVEDLEGFVTHLDALVMARSGFHHSVNYRAVMAFGTANTRCDGSRISTGASSSETSSARDGSSAGNGANLAGTNSCVL